MNIEIIGMREDNTPGTRSDAIGRFDFKAGPFRVRRCAIRKHHDTGNLFIATPGRTVTGGVSIDRSGEFWQELEKAALETFNDRS